MMMLSRDKDPVGSVTPTINRYYALSSALLLPSRICLYSSSSYYSILFLLPWRLQDAVTFRGEEEKGEEEEESEQERDVSEALKQRG